MINIKNLNLIELDSKESIKIQGGYFLAVVGGAAALVGLYEWGYQYAKRRLEHA